MLMLSDAKVRAIQPPAKGQKLYFDQSLSGFGIRVSQGGTKTFVLVTGKDRRFITIGRYPILSLSQARAEAKRQLAEFTLGKSRPQTISYERAVELFLEDKRQNRRGSTVNGYRLKLARLKLSGPVDRITHDEAARRVNLIKAPSERSHVLVAGKCFFSWCMKRRYRQDNPLIGLSKQKSVPRKRILSDEEIIKIFKAEGTFADYCKLLLLTGQRRGELRHALTAETTLTIPSEVSKNHRTHTIPLTPWAKSLWRSWPTFDWSWYKTQIDEQTGITDWVLHDIRRTFRTNLSKLGVPRDIAERLLNHISFRDPMEDVYDHHNFLPQMEEALLKWEGYLQALLARELCRDAA